MENDVSDYQIDKLDRQILKELQKDSRLSFLELSKQLKVSGGTIHQRVEKLKKAGIIHSFSVELNSTKLGYGVSVLIGIYLNNAKDSKEVFSKIEKFSEVTEAYYTTGTYASIIKVEVKDIPALQKFLSDRLQSIPQIRSTESFVILSTVFKRSPF